MTVAPNQIWHAFAKVNLELEIRGRRPDGYHEIVTVLQTVDLSDRIRVFGAEEFRFSSNVDPKDSSNLVVAAARAFEAETGRTVRLHLDLEKRIPLGAGLGGGSADAAVTFMGLDRYYAARIPGERMRALLGQLGSDVPFFQVGGRALAVGRGEIVFPLGQPPGEETGEWFVLVCPPIHVSTAEAYSWLTQTTESNRILGFCAHFVAEPGPARAGCEVRANDFEEPLFRRFPELVEIKRELMASGARSAGLSGSGSTLFGEFETEAGARASARKIGRRVNAMAVRALGRGEYFSRMFRVSGPGSL